MTIEKFLMLVSLKRAESRNLRYGQACFNVLRQTVPELAEDIRGSENDPFYDNARVEAFLKIVRADSRFILENGGYRYRHECET